MNRDSAISVAIDGPGGSGKSTAAKYLAKTLNFIYIDTGAMYRSVGLYCLEHGADTENQEAVEAVLADIQLDIQYDGGEQRIFLNQEDVTKRIRTQKVGKAASNVAKFQAVREWLVALQRQLANCKNVIMDGRDIGTNVLPNATLKIYLDAAVSVRTERRMKELSELGETPIYETIQTEIEDRDFQDKNRKLSPLCVADDAIVIDASDLGIEDVTDRIMKLLGR